MPIVPYQDLHDASELLWEKLQMLSPSQQQLFQERLMMSWIFHDFALEGSVLTIAEIKAAIDDEIISAPSLIPSYHHIIALRDGIRRIVEARGKKQFPLNLDWLKKLHQILLPTDRKDQTQYRKDNPIHRLYFHDLAQADKISYQMRKLTDWFRTDECKYASPIEIGCKVHRDVIRIFPWPDISGRVARLAMNHVLINHGFWPALIHHVDRQHYYEALKSDQNEIETLVAGGVEGGLKAANKLYQGIVDSTRRL
jgi:Fic family protein